MGQKQVNSPQHSAPAPAVSEETILKITKEIAVKFIEVGRLTPATFDETFKSIYQTIVQSIATDD